MMKVVWLKILFVLYTVFSLAISCVSENQTSAVRNQEKNELMAHLRFLASDELMGRKVGTTGAHIAARYIAEQFRAAGLQRFETFNDYLQPVEFLTDNEEVSCQNVAGFIKGTHPQLKNEYVLLCAHYDHLGVQLGKNHSGEDSIYNGARDNAMGTAALIYAAKELSKFPLERSVIFVATTGEEEGMLGARYFIEHCPIALQQIVFVLNNDGGGFNDTTKIRVGGKNQVEFSSQLWNPVENLGVACLPYPKELAYLYEKGDNIVFAKNGIPSITISPGFDRIDDEILKYVHQTADEATDDFDYSYLLKFSQVYALLAQEISNAQSVPFWKKESEYHRRGVKLYSN